VLKFSRCHLFLFNCNDDATATGARQRTRRERRARISSRRPVVTVAVAGFRGEWG